MTRIWSLGFIFFLGVTIVTGWYFPSWSDGLASFEAGGAFYCRELMSSGGDDDSQLGVSILFLLPLIFRSLQASTSPTQFEVVVVAASYLLFWVWVTLGLECGEVFYTTFVLLDPALLMLFLAQALSLIFFFVLLSIKR